MPTCSRARRSILTHIGVTRECQVSMRDARYVYEARVFADPSYHAWNSLSAKYLKGLDPATVMSVETSFHRLLRRKVVPLFSDVVLTSGQVYGRNGSGGRSRAIEEKRPTAPAWSEFSRVIGRMGPGRTPCSQQGNRRNAFWPGESAASYPCPKPATGWRYRAIQFFMTVATCRRTGGVTMGLVSLRLRRSGST
jgi:hypothetical protein